MTGKTWAKCVVFDGVYFKGDNVNIYENDITFKINKNYISLLSSQCMSLAEHIDRFPSRKIFL